MTEEVQKDASAITKALRWRHDDHVFRTERYPAQPAPGKYTAWCGRGVEQEGVTSSLAGWEELLHCGRA